MSLKLQHDPHRLHVFHEGRKRRIFIGELRYLKEQDCYEFCYDKEYAYSKKAIPVGVELDLFHLKHLSPKGKLFPSFADRIPLKANPAYKDYCASQGISTEESNPIVLLTSIGRRGPSSFVFEPVYRAEFSIEDVLKLQKDLGITKHDFAKAFDVSELTLQKIVAGKSKDFATLKRLQIYWEFPEVALWQLKQTGSRIHGDVLVKLINYFNSQ